MRAWLNSSWKGTEQYALESYQWMLERILMDMGISTMVERVRFVIRPDQTLFIISCASSSPGASPRVRHRGHGVPGGGTFITIKDESYAPRLLASLWRLYGRGAGGSS